MSQEIVDETLKQLYGRPCWGLSYERRLNLSMNFGKPSLTIREPFKTNSKSVRVREFAKRRRVTVRGEWWLWIYGCYWRLLANDEPLAKGSSSIRRIEQAITRVEGEKLKSVAINRTTGATRFCFDLGGVLECRRFDRESDKELWLLYKPDGYVLSVRGNGLVTHKLATA